MILSAPHQNPTFIELDRGRNAGTAGGGLAFPPRKRLDAIGMAFSLSPELYISVDVETSGPIPEEYSLLSIGACVVGDPAKNFYIELVPLNNNYTQEAMDTCDLSLAELRHRGTPPPAAMQAMADWVRQVAQGTRPIFVGFNAPFDWSFVNYYFIKFCGLDQNPFGHSALDIKSYYMGAYKTTWHATSLKRLPSNLHAPDRPLAHNALDDAIQQAEIFERLIQPLSVT